MKCKFVAQGSKQPSLSYISVHFHLFIISEQIKAYYSLMEMNAS